MQRLVRFFLSHCLSLSLSLSIHISRKCEGLFREDFDINLGDCLDVSDDENGPERLGGSAKKARGVGLPLLEGSESVEQFVSKYKKTLLNKRSLFKEAKDRLDIEKCQSHQCRVSK